MLYTSISVFPTQQTLQIPNIHPQLSHISLLQLGQSQGRMTLLGLLQVSQIQALYIITFRVWEPSVR